MLIIVPILVLFIGNRGIPEKAITYLLCVGSTFCYDFRFFGFSLSQILLVIAVFFGLLYKDSAKERRISREALKIAVFFYLTYIVLVTFIGFYYKSDYTVNGGLTQNQLRPFVQSVQAIFTFITVVVVTRFNNEISLNILSNFHNVLVIFSIIGILQTTIFFVTGFDILPMRKDFISEINGLSVVGPNGLLRATAGMGEPKQYAKFMVFGFAMELLLYEILGRKSVSWKNVVLFVIAIYVSSSTTGYVIAFVVLLFYFYKKFKNNNNYLLIGVVLISIIAPLIFNSNVITEKFIGAENRGEIIGLEDADTAAYKWLSTEPQYLITGTGIANTVAYANEYAPSATQYINKHPYTLRRGVIKSLAEGGILGLLLQLCVVFKLYSGFRHNCNLKIFGLFIIVMHFFLTSEAILEVQFILLALLYSIGNCNEEGENYQSLTN